VDFCQCVGNDFLISETSSGENNCVRFGKIASLFAFVLFAGGYVVRIAYESFLDFSFSEFFMLYRTANSSSLYFS